MRMILFVLLFLLLPLVAEAQPVRVITNGAPLTTATSVIHSNRTMLPLRAVLESFGATMTWDRATRQITANLQGKIIQMQVNNPAHTVNGEMFALDTFPSIVNGRILVPARFFSEVLGKNVVWSANERSVRIESALLSPATVTVPPAPSNAINNRLGIELQDIPNTANGIIRLRGRTAGRTAILVERNGVRNHVINLTRSAEPFDREIFLTEGTGTYNILLLAHKEARTYTVAHRFSVENTRSLNRFLVPGRGIESNHPEIIRLAERITRGLNTDRQRIRAVYDWIRANISYNDEKLLRIQNNPQYNGETGALYALRERKGVCEEFATLSAALLRAVGVQAKVVTGPALGSDGWGLHAWNKAHDGTRWIEFDATFAATGKRNFFDIDLSKTHTEQSTR